MTDRRVNPESVRVKTQSSWLDTPSGITRRPPGELPGALADQLAPGAAVTTIASNGAASGQPREPSPTRR